MLFDTELMEKLGWNVEDVHGIVVEDKNGYMTYYQYSRFCGYGKAAEKAVDFLKDMLTSLPELDGESLIKAMKEVLDDEDRCWWEGKKVGNMSLIFEVCGEKDDALLITVCVDER